MMGTIELIGMEFHVCHGCLEIEQHIENLFVVDFSGEYDMGAAASSDALEDALNYAEIYDAIAKEMAIPAKLLEHLAGRIRSKLIEQFPELQSFTISIAKRRPPVNGVVAWSKVIVEK